jgi:hypothetical protein
MVMAISPQDIEFVPTLEKVETEIDNKILSGMFKRIGNAIHIVHHNLEYISYEDRLLLEQHYKDAGWSYANTFLFIDGYTLTLALTETNDG